MEDKVCWADESDEPEFRDDRTWRPLDPAGVWAAGEEKLKELDRRVCVEADVEECIRGFGVHRSKSRVDDVEGLYAATPPLELVKFLLTNAAASSRSENVRIAMLIDIGKAHLYAPDEGVKYVDLPPERASWGSRSIGCQPQEAGFVTGLATACTFFAKEKNIRVVVHGDDFIIEGVECDLKWVEATVSKKYIVTMRAMLGPERTDNKVAVILNRVVEWKDEECWHEAGPGKRGEDAERHGAGGGQEICGASDQDR